MLKPVGRFEHVPGVEVPVNFKPRKEWSCQRSISWDFARAAGVGVGDALVVVVRAETARVRRVGRCIFVGFGGWFGVECEGMRDEDVKGLKTICSIIKIGEERRAVIVV